MKRNIHYLWVLLNKHQYLGILGKTFRHGKENIHSTKLKLDEFYKHTNFRFCQPTLNEKGIRNWNTIFLNTRLILY